MRGPSRRFSIAANTSKLDVDNRFPIKKYYRTADTILRQAHIYREEKNFIELYVLLLRFSSLVGETIPEHQDYASFPARERAVYNQKFRHVLVELERLKPEVQRQVEQLNEELLGAAALQTNSPSSAYEWPPIAREPAFQKLSSQKNELVPWRTKDLSHQLGEVHFNSLSFKFHPPNKETLSRHSILGPDGLRARWTPPVTQARVEYPSYFEATPADTASLDQNWSKTLGAEEPLKLAAIEHVDEDSASQRLVAGNVPSEPRSIKQSPPPAVVTACSHCEGEPTSQRPVKSSFIDSLLEPSLIKQPSPPPVAAPVQDLQIMADLMQLCKPQDSFSCSELVESLPLPMPAPTKDLKQSENPKRLHISTAMMDEFMKLARKNTKNNIETCGVLAGSLKNGMFCVTTLIIPKQQATSDSCQTINEEEIFEYQDKRGLFQLGWIHTHPTQSCFMSSVDLHTHYSYQVMLPEAIAIVMAPTDSRRKYGIFRLSEPGGVKVIQKCELRGFHAHESPSDGKPIYESCSHVSLGTGLRFQVVDLR